MADKKRQYSHHKKTGVTHPDDYKSLRNPKTVTVCFNDTGDRHTFAEWQLRHNIRECERSLYLLPNVKTLEELFNRVKAGLRILVFLEKSHIGMEDTLFLLDDLYGGKTQYVSIHDDLGMIR